MKFEMLKDMVGKHVDVVRKTRAMFDGKLLAAGDDGILVEMADGMNVYVAMSDINEVSCAPEASDDNPMAGHDEPSPI